MPINTFDPNPSKSPGAIGGYGPAARPAPAYRMPDAPPVISQPTEKIVDTNINVIDIQKLLTAVEIAAQRGSYKAQEMSEIGTTYDKISGFIKTIVAANIPQQPQPQMNNSEPVVPMTPPFAPKTGV